MVSDLYLRGFHVHILYYFISDIICYTCVLALLLCFVFICSACACVRV